MKRLPYTHDGMVKGDTLSLAIAMASLIAKVARIAGCELILNIPNMILNRIKDMGLLSISKL